MIFWAAFAAELLVLFFTSRFIFQALFFFFYKIFRKKEWAAIPVFILFFPGVVLHELSHFLVAEILLVKTHDFVIAPKIEHGNFRMGSVEISRTDIFRSFLIGIAPVVLGLLVMLGVLFSYINFLHPELFYASFLNILKTVLIIYVIFFIANTMFSSKKDMEGSFVLLLITIFVGLFLLFAGYFLKVDFVQPLLRLVTSARVVEGLRFAVLLLLIPVGINIAIYVFARVALGKLLRP